MPAPPSALVFLRLCKAQGATIRLLCRLALLCRVECLLPGWSGCGRPLPSLPLAPSPTTRHCAPLPLHALMLLSPQRTAAAVYRRCRPCYLARFLYPRQRTSEELTTSGTRMRGQMLTPLQWGCEATAGPALALALQMGDGTCSTLQSPTLVVLGHLGNPLLRLIAAQPQAVRDQPLGKGRVDRA